MIKVNLLKDPTARAHKTFTKPTVSRTGLALVAFIILVAGSMGAWYFYINTQKKDLTVQKNDLRIREAELIEVKEKLIKSEAMKKERLRRISVIENLKERQTGPVLLLNHVLHSIPPNGLIWLTSLDQKSNRVDITGYTQKIEAIPDFMTNLEKTGFFQSVDLVTVESQKEASRFSLLCVSAQFQPEE
jgi:type IV pilus assembly protein PilN